MGKDCFNTMITTVKNFSNWVTDDTNGRDKRRLIYLVIVLTEINIYMYLASTGEVNPSLRGSLPSP